MCNILHTWNILALFWYLLHKKEQAWNFYIPILMILVITKRSYILCCINIVRGVIMSHSTEFVWLQAKQSLPHPVHSLVITCCKWHIHVWVHVYIYIYIYVHGIYLRLLRICSSSLSTATLSLSASWQDRETCKKYPNHMNISKTFSSYDMQHTGLVMVTLKENSKQYNGDFEENTIFLRPYMKDYCWLTMLTRH